MPIAFLLLVVILLSGCGTVPIPRGPAALTASTPVRLWQDASIFDAVASLMRDASREVMVEMYEFERPDLLSAMAAAAGRGAAVRLVYDPSVRVSARTATAAVHLGIGARPYPLDDRRHQIDHVKLLLTDAGALVGGMNWGRRSSANHDYALELHAAPMLSGLRAVFEHDWALAGGTVTGDPRLPPGVLETTPGELVRAALVAGSKAAGEIRAEVFDLTDRGVIAELAAARRRGARVRVLLDPNQPDNAAALRLLRTAGIEAALARVLPGAKLHAKAALFGDRLLVGSANWTASGLGVNHELDVETDDDAAVAAFRDRFEADWAARVS